MTYFMDLMNIIGTVWLEKLPVNVKKKCIFGVFTIR